MKKLFNKQSIMTALATSAILFASSMALADDHATKHEQKCAHSTQHKQGHQAGHNLKHMAKFLKLSDAQKEQLQAIFSQEKAERKAKKDSHKVDREQFQQKMKLIISAEEFDEAAFISLHEQHQDKCMQIKVAKAKTKHATLQVLTAEQKKKWHKFKKKSMHKAKH